MITLSAPPKRSSIAVSRIRIACLSAIAAPVMLVLIVIGTSGTPSRLRIAIGSIEPLSGSSRQMTPRSTGMLSKTSDEDAVDRLGQRRAGEQALGGLGDEAHQLAGGLDDAPGVVVAFGERALFGEEGEVGAAVAALQELVEVLQVEDFGVAARGLLLVEDDAGPRGRGLRADLDVDADRAEVEAITAPQRLLGHVERVDPRAVLAPEIAQHPAVVFAGDAGVLARDALVGQVEIAVGGAADHDRAIADREEALPVLFLDAEAADDAIAALQAACPRLVPEVRPGVRIRPARDGFREIYRRRVRASQAVDSWG